MSRRVLVTGAAGDDALARRAPRRAADRLTPAVLRRRVRTGRLDASPLAGDLARALRS